MSPLRRNMHSGGGDVLQMFDAVDLMSGAPYTYANRPVAFGARYGWSLVDGLPVFGMIRSTFGPVGGYVYAPPTGARKLGQWSMLFPCKVTTTSPLKVTPIKETAGPFNVDATLGEIECTAPASYTPTLDDSGMLCQGTDTGALQLIFFPCSTGGGGSAGGAPGIWGDGSDSNLALNGVTAHFGFSSAGTLGRLYAIDTEAMTGLGSGNTDPKHYYLNRDVKADTITLSPGVTLHTAGWILWAYKIIGDNTTAIDFSPESYYQACRTDPTLGFQAGFNTGGGYTFTMGASGSGGNAANQGGVPATGIPLENGTYRFYGRGGDGGAGATQPGGWRNTIPPVINPHYRHFPPFNYGDGFVGVNFHGGAGGGGGDTTAGGAAGGPMLVFCRDLSAFEGIFRTEGAKGFATTGVNKNGPGGGGGGHQRIFTLIDGPFTTSVAGGLGRAGTGSGAAGQDGYPGLAVRHTFV